MINSKRSEEPRELLASTGFLLARLGMESRRRFTRMMARHHLSMHHFGVLMALGGHEARPQQRLGRLTGVDPRNAVPIIDELESRGLIVRRIDPEDRRRYNIRLTPPGRKLIQDLRRDGKELERDMLKPLSELERSELHSILLRLFSSIGGADKTDA